MESREKKQFRFSFKPLLIIIAAFILIPACYFCFFLNRPGRARTELRIQDTDIRVATVNINNFKFATEPEQTALFLLQAARKHSVDILCIQEYYTHWKFTDEQFCSIFSEDYPYIVYEGEHAVVSRIPIENHRLFEYEQMNSGSYMHTVFCDGDGSTFSIVSVHLQSTGIYFAHRRDDIRPGTLMALMKQNRIIRNHQASEVHKLVKGLDTPVLVCGDFNSLPLSTSQMRVKRGMKDSFMRAGHGRGCTYRYMKNLLRIDYILCDKSFRPLECIIENAYLSDHRMVVSTFRRI